MTFLKINNLSVDYQMRKETVNTAKNVNIEVNKGEILGLVGESGSGKSTVGNAIINLIDEPGKVSSGSVILGDLNIHENSESIVKYRGNKIGLVFQNGHNLQEYHELLLWLKRTKIMFLPQQLLEFQI